MLETGERVEPARGLLVQKIPDRRRVPGAPLDLRVDPEVGAFGSAKKR